jgi:hypothetical protein
MWKAFLGLVLAFAAAAAEAHPGTPDPLAFMRARYAEYGSGGQVSTLATDTYASARLLPHLYAFDEAAGGQELDELEPWTDSIGWRIDGRVRLIPLRTRHAGRRTILASFVNRGRLVRLTFRWVRENGAWYLDEIVRPGRRGWTLTQRLARRPTAPPNP